MTIATKRQSPDDPPHTSPAIDVPSGPLGVEVVRLRHVYDGVPVLDGVSFGVRPMEGVAVVGPVSARTSPAAAMDVMAGVRGCSARASASGASGGLRPTTSR